MNQVILQSEKLKRAGVVHGFTSRVAGDVLGSLRGWEKATGLYETFLVRLNQVHGTDVLAVDRPISELPVGKALSYDASVTDRSDVILSIRTADCVPVLLYAAEPRAIGAVHAGWRGTLAGTVTHAVSVLENLYDVEPRNLIAALGPCIQPCCYEVGEDVYKRFVDRFGSEAVAIVGDKTCVDLVAVNRLWLIECGVSTENIDNLGLCTYCNPDLFFSYRRDAGQSGRHLSYITLRDTP